MHHLQHNFLSLCFQSITSRIACSLPATKMPSWLIQWLSDLNQRAWHCLLDLRSGAIRRINSFFSSIFPPSLNLFKRRKNINMREIPTERGCSVGGTDDLSPTAPFPLVRRTSASGVPPFFLRRSSATTTHIPLWGSLWQYQAGTNVPLLPFLPLLPSDLSLRAVDCARQDEVLIAYSQL